MNKLKVGFIGTGTIGQMHIKHWSKLPQCEVVAASDLRPELLELVTEKFNVPRSYSSHVELINNPDIQAVVVVTRRHNTAATVYDCLKAGKHVFSEKPMAKTAEQAKKLVDTAKTHDRVYAIGYQRRHDAGTQIAKRVFDELIESQELGKIVFVRSWNFTGQDRVPGEDFVMTAEERPAGLLWEQTPAWLPPESHKFYDHFVNVCSHDINMLRYLFNCDPKVNYANLNHPHGWVVVFDLNGQLSVFDGGFNELNKWEERGEWDEGIEVFFELGRLTIKFSPPIMHHRCTTVELIQGDKPKKVLSDGTTQTAAFELEASSFIQDVLQGREPLASGRDALKDMETIESIWKHCH